MTVQQPTCMGCFVNNPNQWIMPNYQFPAQPGLTDREKECLRHLTQAWEAFMALDEKHPQDNSEFCTAIHDAQKMIALRVARRIDKDIWSQWD